jgi:hypothetical protein
MNKYIRPFPIMYCAQSRSIKPIALSIERMPNVGTIVRIEVLLYETLIMMAYQPGRRWRTTYGGMLYRPVRFRPPWHLKEENFYVAIIFSFGKYTVYHSFFIYVISCRTFYQEYAPVENVCCWKEYILLLEYSRLRQTPRRKLSGNNEANLLFNVTDL